MLKCFNLISESLYFTVVLLKIPIMDKDGFSLIFFILFYCSKSLIENKCKKKEKHNFEYCSCLMEVFLCQSNKIKSYLLENASNLSDVIYRNRVKY